ncbi:DUF692 family multinuclear iron-containing protein [Sulfobacillus sp. hq2]|uniref:multinuclear nonheme iron-dependent oxidase n=1 Tax=Sulfobacillus sp. hq2 TaxID=2039167 RepID=UPI000CD0BCD2|nr:DUF692 family multinuclear iron-containing protein [Sulfobacillus sp. hq2]POB11050.1 hypothetical protein CO251_05730 [Sulfobacillus sp. hq2]
MNEIWVGMNPSDLTPEVWDVLYDGRLPLELTYDGTKSSACDLRAIYQEAQSRDIKFSTLHTIQGGFAEESPRLLDDSWVWPQGFSVTRLTEDLAFFNYQQGFFSQANRPIELTVEDVETCSRTLAAFMRRFEIEITPENPHFPWAPVEDMCLTDFMMEVANRVTCRFAVDLSHLTGYASVTHRKAQDLLDRLLENDLVSVFHISGGGFRPDGVFMDVHGDADLDPISLSLLDIVRSKPSIPLIIEVFGLRRHKSLQFKLEQVKEALA